MTVRRGEVFGFLGPNGAGKTTAVKLLLGLVRPTGGEALVLGAPAGDRETRRQHRLPARAVPLPELADRPRGAGAALPAAAACPRARRPAAADDALATVGLAERGDDKVRHVLQGHAAAPRPGGGPAGRARAGRPRRADQRSRPGRAGTRSATIIRELRGRGTTVFLNTHLLEEAEQVCDRVAVIDQGRSLATGTLAELRRAGLERPAPGDRAARRLVASPAGPGPVERRGGVAAGRGTSPRRQVPDAGGGARRPRRPRRGGRAASSRASKTAFSSCWGSDEIVPMSPTLP